jgi:hypothetical protein
VAPVLPGIDVGDVHLHYGQAGGGQGIPQGEAVVGEGTRVDDDAIGPGGLRLEEVNDSALAVGLEESKFNLQLPGLLFQEGFELLQGLCPVVGGFPVAKQVQVRAVDY